MLVCNHVSYVDAMVIAACVRRPIRFVMDHQIFRIPVLSFIFRAMRAIPIAPARVDAALKERAIGEAQAALAAGELVGIFPEGRLTTNGELSAFRPGVQQIVAAVPAPVVPMALSGLWGSLFSRAHPVRLLLKLNGVLAPIAFVVAPPLAPAAATPETLQAIVLELRGDVR